MHSNQNDGSGFLEIIKVADFEISGNGKASSWQQTGWTDIPRTMGTANYSTKVKVLYSDTGIYFLFHCEDKVINATMQEDNLNLWEEDVVEVFLQPDENYPLYFEYQVSPLNYEVTLLIPNLEGGIRGWLPWRYEGSRKTRHETTILKDNNGTVEGWTAEFFIPYSLMAPLIPRKPEAGTKWKANMYRLDYDEGQTRFTWQKTDRNFHEPHNFGTFIFK
jgi:hypothetical protein